MKNEEEIRTEETPEEKTEMTAEKTGNTDGGGEKKPAPVTSKIFSSGKLKLEKPFMASGKEITEISFDFQSLTGWEYVEALDGSNERDTDPFTLTNRQAMSLFAVAVEKMTPDVDRRDVKERIGIADTVKAIQAAKTFFVLASREGNGRLLNL